MTGAGAWYLPPLRDGRPADAGLLERRARAAGSTGEGDAPKQALIGGVRCLLVEPQNGPAQGDILYLHGGGYRLGSPVAYIAYAQGIADQAGRRIILPFYPLAPENPFPAALHSIVAVYRALEDSQSAVIAGDSAGGGLTAALCILAARAGERPAGAILVSPMLDLTAQGDSLDRNAERDPLFSKAAVLDSAQLYLQGHAPDDPLVSALNADPADFPSTLILTGSAEVLLDEALAFARKLAIADRRVTLHVAPGMGHVWPLMAPGSPEAAAAVATMAAFTKALKSAVSGASM
ncbi:MULTISPECIES: alpha/beta hydrolase [Sphingobium]|uniref:Alpha/beta hydrolase n=1 Tax=Sphingobium tyrosinilyticum TaxID=2715436 RepID=A0ABV9EU49_9SPHN|nr:alpha/beta hydrolase [Sphingobium sp. EP60837]ANI79656.1 Putative acetyl-hydrolase LipR [Sphingobium sp. EP60837]